MRSGVAVHFACNDPDNGDFAGKAGMAAVSVGGELMDLELDFMGGVKFTEARDFIRIHRQKFKIGRDEKDEVHISPLQLDVIERCIDLWSLPGETVLTPFLGIGSEVYAAVEMGRKGVGFELKPSYFAQAKRNLNDLHRARTDDMFAA